MQLHDLSLAALCEALRRRETSSVEATRACLQRAQQTERLRAYLHVDEQGALAQAGASDARRQAGRVLGPLDGVPIGLKDVFLTEGLPTTAGSKILEGFIAPYDGTAVRKLKAAGAVIIGKLNLDEFAMGSSTEHSAYGVTRNPWDESRVPGGSSGGSAVAVAVGSAFGALGTDTGGSIRQPASFTGTVGLRPTYGRVSRYGVIAYASSLDQVGPMGRSVADCALLLGAIAGHDANDSTSMDLPVPDYAAELAASLDHDTKESLRGLRIGVPTEYFVDGMDSQVRAAVDAALAYYRSQGATLCDISLPHTEHGVATYYLIATAEASSNLARYDGVRYGLRSDPGKGLKDMYCATRGAGFGDEVKRRIMLGTYALSAGYYDAYYLKAQKVRTLVRRDFERAFEKVDVIATPTTPTAAFRIGENAGDPIKMYLGDVFTVGPNLAGLPGISLPCGFTSEGLPMGLQLLGPWWQESRLMQVAQAYERGHDWHTRRARVS